MTKPAARSIVVTGASTGIGRAAVEAAVKGGAHVFAGVRKPLDAEGLKAEFGEAVTPLLFDVTDEAAVRAAARAVEAALGDQRLMGLVNNAGVAVAGPLLYLDPSELRRQMEVNFLGLHTVTQAFLPLLGADPERKGKPGRIVMISSIGGERAMPFIGAYAASKFAIEGYSESLRRELLPFGVDVIVVAPGAIATPIWDKADDDETAAVYANTPYAEALGKMRAYMLDIGRKGLPASAVGALIWRCLTDAKPKVRYRILRGEFAQMTLPGMMPPRMLDKIVARRLGLKRAT